jgi:GDPmannose 4,6-dehydratase
MARRALITGVSGQDGAYLAKCLLERGYEVFGSSREPAIKPWRLLALDVADRVSILPAGRGSLDDFRRLIATVGPDEIYNLAAQTSLTEAAKAPVETAELNALGPVHLFEAARVEAPKVRIFQASSAQVYGRAALPTYTSEGPFAPTNLYGASKLFAQLAADHYRTAFKMFVSCGIFFAHESPLRGEEFLSRKVTSTLAAIRAGRASRLSVGNMDASRDWGSAEDFVRGMALSLAADEPGDFVFATGEVHTVRELIQTAAACLGFDLEWTGTGVHEAGVDRKTGARVVDVDPRFFRPFEEATPPADISATTARLGWRPTTQFSNMIARMCEADLRAQAPDVAARTSMA